MKFVYYSFFSQSAKQSSSQKKSNIYEIMRATIYLPRFIMNNTENKSGFTFRTRANIFLLLFFCRSRVEEDGFQNYPKTTQTPKQFVCDNYRYTFPYMCLYYVNSRYTVYHHHHDLHNITPPPKIYIYLYIDVG